MKGLETIKTQKEYTTEELYNLIKDVNFSAGKPEFIEHGRLKKIKLPAVGRYCITILAGGKQIQLSMVQDLAQTDQVAKNAVIGGALGIFSGLLDNDKAPSQQLLEKTAAELRSHLGL